MTYLDHYYAGVSQTDAQVGRLMNTLDRLNLWNQTIVIFVGDHGYHLGERGWWNKGTLFELSCRAPCIIVAPGIKPAVCRSLIEFMDIYPTVTELCGLRAPAHVEGKSLVPLLKDPTKTIRDAAVTHVTRGPEASGFSMRTDRWRYTQWSDGTAELYDHDRDPGEWRNLARDPQHAETGDQLARKLEAMKAQ
jgi:arylsulfatase A-like enzyme